MELMLSPGCERLVLGTAERRETERAWWGRRGAGGLGGEYVDVDGSSCGLVVAMVSG